uniref:Uncharacterized protein n=1 Tax=Nelumbo nucifera TaxID=4432 RepID=A0A822YU22_NELNU|nr:TPA_asm: hypothetical protein HUJ06_006792 [Nelumbo nucifera]
MPCMWFKLPGWRPELLEHQGELNIGIVDSLLHRLAGMVVVLMIWMHSS